MILRVCYFGFFDPDYSRNRVIIKGLRENGTEVVLCNVRRRGGQIVSQARLAIEALSKARIGFDVILIGYPGWLAIPCAKLLSKVFNKPIAFDAFISLYDTEVFDRHTVPESSFKAHLWYLMDRESCQMADMILLDTKQHIEYFHKTFRIEKEKFCRVLIGSDDDIFYPRETRRDPENFVVAFWGTYIPLQGIRYIIQAAKLLESHEDIRFEMMGRGPMFDEISQFSRRLRVKNVEFHRLVPYLELPDHIARASICLGIFGETEKAQRVIPNKVYEALAMGKPLITGDTPAIKEILRNKENSILCRVADPQAIADSILSVKHDKELRERIAANGYRVFRSKLTPKAIGNDLLSRLNALF